MNWPHVSIGQHVRIRVLAFTTIAVTAVISFSSLRNLAELAGFGQLGWLFPVCLDAVAALGMDLWLSDSPARRGARTLALAAIAMSTAGNIGDWGIRSKVWSAPIWLAPALGAIPPLGLASLLLVLHRHVGAKPGPRQVRHADTGPVTEPLRTIVDPVPEVQVDLGPVMYPVPSDARPAPRTKPKAPRTTRVAGTRSRTGPDDDELIAIIRQLEQDQGQLDRRSTMSRFGVGSNRATRLLAAARNGQGQEPGHE